MTNRSLFHWGIPGMKWGVRRRQSNTTITGKPHSSDHTTAVSLKKKHISEMSNDELKKLTTRLQLEKQYKDLTKVDLGPGQKIVTEVLLGLGKQAATSYLSKNLPKVLETAFNSVMGIKKTPFNPQGTDVPLTPSQVAEAVRKMNGG